VKHRAGQSTCGAVPFYPFLFSLCTFLSPRVSVSIFEDSRNLGIQQVSPPNEVPGCLDSLVASVVTELMEVPDRYLTLRLAKCIFINGSQMKAAIFRPFVSRNYRALVI
jgi:hypothetical protein